MTPRDRLRRMIAANSYLALSTSHENHPWISPLYFAFDEDLNFYFISRRDSRHAEHIRKQANVAIAIYDSTCVPGQCDCVQATATARELADDEEIAHAANILFTRRFPDAEKRKKYLDPDRYRGETLMRLYKVTPAEIFVVDQERANDYRVRVDLSA